MKGSGAGVTAANLVRDARAKRGMSQRALARHAGVPQSTVSSVESGQRQPSVAMLERLLGAAGFRLQTHLVNAIRPSELLELHHEEVADLLARHRISRAWVFGSVARGDDRPDSDLDLLVELTSDVAIDDFVGLEDELSAMLGCPVDVVTTKELESNELFRRRVDRDRRGLTVAA